MRWGEKSNSRHCFCLPEIPDNVNNQWLLTLPCIRDTLNVSIHLNGRINICLYVRSHQLKFKGKNLHSLESILNGKRLHLTGEIIC